jgi:iron-sulfur cluster repair protein YtfE (RIC family)
MPITTDTPADTTMMRIVHDALRRDLERAIDVLREPERVGAAQRRAIGAHLSWMVRFLHAHHSSEDAGLYPLVRERGGADPAVRAVLDRMQRGHEDVAGAMAAVEHAAAELAAAPTDEAVQRTAEVLDQLGAALLPHLREEETEAMPIVSRLVTAAEWHAIDKEHNLDPKSMSQLGFEGHWLIDSASDADRATVLGLVPPIPRFLLLHGWARRYRRHAEACWGRAGRPPRRVQLANRVAVTVAADIDEVWDVVRDVTRVGEWSHECVGAAWMAGAHAAVPGARFRGRNRSGVLRWGRVCEVVSADPYELVWVTVPTARYPDSSEWRITLTKVDGGTEIAQQFRVLRAPKVLAVLYALLIPGHRDRTAALLADLTRLGTVAARSRMSA